MAETTEKANKRSEISPQLRDENFKMKFTVGLLALLCEHVSKILDTGGRPNLFQRGLLSHLYQKK